MIFNRNLKKVEMNNTGAAMVALCRRLFATENNPNNKFANLEDKTFPQSDSTMSSINVTGIDFCRRFVCTQDRDG